MYGSTSGMSGLEWTRCQKRGPSKAYKKTVWHGVTHSENRLSLFLSVPSCPQFALTFSTNPRPSLLLSTFPLLTPQSYLLGCSRDEWSIFGTQPTNIINAHLNLKYTAHTIQPFYLPFKTVFCSVLSINQMGSYVYMHSIQDQNHP